VKEEILPGNIAASRGGNGHGFNSHTFNGCSFMGRGKLPAIVILSGAKNLSFFDRA
jgi:hypothetical protein